MALFRGIQEYISRDANNIVSISGNIFLYPSQDHPILHNYSIEGYDSYHSVRENRIGGGVALYIKKISF